jgi:hypothetical protein
MATRLTKNTVAEEEIDPQRYYASYTIAVYFQQGAVYDHKDCVPCEFRHVGLHRAAGYSCPRHKDTPRQFECTRLITADHVRAIIRRVPGFGKHRRR